MCVPLGLSLGGRILLRGRHHRVKSHSPVSKPLLEAEPPRPHGCLQRVNKVTGPVYEVTSCLPSEATAAQRGTPGCRFHPERPTTAQPGAPLRAACFPAKSRTDAERRRSPRPQPGPRYPILPRKPDKTWERPCAPRYHTPKATRASVLSAGLWATLAGSVSCAWIVEHSRDQASGTSVDVIARTSSLWTAALAVSLRSPSAALPELRPGPRTPRASPAACPSENCNDDPPPPPPGERPPPPALPQGLQGKKPNPPPRLKATPRPPGNPHAPPPPPPPPWRGLPSAVLLQRRRETKAPGAIPPWGCGTAQVPC